MRCSGLLKWEILGKVLGTSATLLQPAVILRFWKGGGREGMLISLRNVLFRPDHWPFWSQLERSRFMHAYDVMKNICKEANFYNRKVRDIRGMVFITSKETRYAKHLIRCWDECSPLSSTMPRQCGWGVASYGGSRYRKSLFSHESSASLRGEGISGPQACLRNGYPYAFTSNSWHRLNCLCPSHWTHSLFSTLSDENGNVLIAHAPCEINIYGTNN